jgi:hypothetical protein
VSRQTRCVAELGRSLGNQARRLRRRKPSVCGGLCAGGPARGTPGRMLARLVIKTFPGHLRTGQRGSSRSAQAASHNVLTVTRMLLRAAPTGGQNQKVPLPSWPRPPRKSPGMPS